MAGAGYKLYATGDILTAAQVNNYLQEQTVMVFADASARTTALSGVLAEGMISYLKDTNSTEYYSGSAWVAIGGGGSSAGKVLQVVQGTTTTSTTISSTSLTDTTITASITPTLNTSKILVMVDAQAYITRASTSTFTGWALLRGASNIYDRSNEGFMAITASTATAVELVANSQMIYLDSPATTSATTYKAQAKIATGSITFQRNSVPSSITLMEIGV
jgi:hypothetical protein